jgi:4-hydroxyacetophenone monooxygenase
MSARKDVRREIWSRLATGNPPGLAVLYACTSKRLNAVSQRSLVMPSTRAIALISEDDAFIRNALAEAHLPSLLTALAHLTGDPSLLRAELTPSTDFLAGEQGGLTPELQDEARDVAFRAIRTYRDGGCKPAPHPSDDSVRRMIDFMTGGAAGDAYVPLLREELEGAERDMRAPQWTRESLDGQAPFFVAIIGAGMSGLLAAHRLKQAHVPVVILEKNNEVGGTWFENQYPGARVDNPNYSYSYSFAQKSDWPFHYSPQRVLLDYFRECAEDFGLRGDIRFRTEVLSADWDEARCLWSLRVRTPSGAEETVEANAVISAVGQLNRPKMPEIRGMTAFEGPSFHSARWDQGVDLRGKRVAVVGTGASASQFIPEVAAQASRLTIFQRTPNWYIPVPTYHDRVGEGLQWLLGHVPHYAQWYRFWLFWVSTDGILPMAKVDPAWPSWELSVGAENQQLRDLMVAYLTEQLQDRPDLIDKVIPMYPPASKRIVIDNGIWPATLKRDNVELVTTPIKEITPRGVVTEAGVEFAADVIIYGTGFQASRFLTPMRVTGRNGADLHAQWSGDARAYMGVAVPNFPNFFMLYGPNTNIVVNGSIIYFSECEVNYLMACVRTLLEGKHRAMDCKPEVHDAYNVRVDEGNRQMAWGVSKVNSWYKNDKGRVTQNWPFGMLEFWQQTRQANPADYVFL